MNFFRSKAQPEDQTDLLIHALYRAFLSRNPEASAFLHWREQLQDPGNLQTVIESFLNSQEFRARNPNFINPFAHDLSPRQVIEAQVDETQLGTIWTNVENTWSKLGTEDPYYSVITDPRYRKAEMTDAAVLGEFYKSGAGDVERLERWLERSALTLKADAVVAEYGCGVGRVTQWFARRFASVLAIDISQSHLDLAARHIREEKLDNVRFLKIGNRHDLEKLSGIDLFYSVIVLQHNPPPVIMTILDAAFRGLAPGGVAFFQVPTYGPHGYGFTASKYIAALGKEEMEMHFLDQKAIFSLAHRHGMIPCEVSQDFCTGGMGVSTTFLMQKA